MRQGENESDTVYMKRFKIDLDTLIAAGGEHVLCSPDLMEAVDKDNPSNKEIETEQNKFKAIVFLKRSDPSRYGEFLAELQNSAHLNRDEYPISETEALDLMVRRSGAFDSSLIGGRNRNNYNRSNRRTGRGRGFNFSQSSSGRGNEHRAPAGTVLVPGLDGRTCNVLCFRCCTWGHYADQCSGVGDNNDSSTGGNTGTGMVQYGYGFNQSPKNGIPREWILLDSCSTDNVFNNCRLLNQIVSCSDDDCLHMTANGGVMNFSLKSTMKLFPLEGY